LFCVLESREGYRIGGFWPRRPPLAALKPMDQIKLVKYDIKRAAEKRKEYVTRWQELVQSR
jgi:hypothetical protein